MGVGFQSPGSRPINGTHEGLDFVHVRVKFKGEARQVKLLQLRTLLRQNGKTSFFHHTDLPLLNVAAIESTHAAEQVAQAYQRDQSAMSIGFVGGMMKRDDLNQVGRKFPTLGEKAPTFTMRESEDLLFRFAQRNCFSLREFEGGPRG